MNVGRIGVIAVQDIVYNKLDWIFRELPTEDYGIDAEIEVNVPEYPTGKLIKLQIKSGESYFSESNEERVIFRFEEKHFQYWLNHSLPVIIVLYNPESKECIWEVVDRLTVQLVSKDKYKILIRKNNRFDESAKAKLIILAYRNNIDLLALNIDKFSVEAQDIFSALNDAQKEQFLKAKEKNDQQNMSTYSEPLNLEFFLRNVFSKIKNKKRDDKGNSKRRNRKNASMMTWPLNRRFFGKQFMVAYKETENFINNKNEKFMIIVGNEGIGKTTFVKEIYEKYRNEHNIILINIKEISTECQAIDKVKEICEKGKLENTDKVIIIDGWDELYSINGESYILSELILWARNCVGIKIIVTLRYINNNIDREINVLKLYPFTEEEGVHYLYCMGVLDKDAIANRNIYNVLRVCNTPLLLNMLIFTCQDLDLSIEEISTEKILYSIMKRHTNEENMILEHLAYEMIHTQRYFISIHDESVLSSMAGYEEIIVEDNQISFVHKMFLDFFAAIYIFKRLFLQEKAIENFERNIYQIFSDDICSVEIFGYIKLLIKNEKKLRSKEYIGRLNNIFYIMLKRGMLYEMSKEQNNFVLISNIFYPVWHLVSYLNKNYCGGFTLCNSEENSKNLTCLIDVFNRVYFSEKYLDFSRTEIKRFKLWRCNLININFKEANLQHVNFLGSCLNYSNFEDADMSYCILISTNMRYANMRNVKLLGANVSYCIVSEESMKYILPYRDTLKGLRNLIIFMENGEIRKYDQYVSRKE